MLCFGDTGRHEAKPNVFARAKPGWDAGVNMKKKKKKTKNSVAWLYHAMHPIRLHCLLKKKGTGSSKSAMMCYSQSVGRDEIFRNKGIKLAAKRYSNFLHYHGMSDTDISNA